MMNSITINTEQFTKDMNREVLVSNKASKRINCKCEKESSNRADAKGYNKTQCLECSEYYWMYFSAKTRKCCECREKNRLLKFGSAVKVKEGYPKDKNIFKSYKEIRGYYCNDELTCLICGNGFVSLPAHLSSIHNIGADEYKKMYGLPLSKGLVTESYSKERSDDCKERQIGKTRKEMLKIAKKIDYDKIRQPNDIIKEHCNTKLSYAVKNNPNHVSKKTKLVDGFCSKCSNKLERKISEYTAIVLGCKILCGACKRDGYLKSQKRYADKIRASK